MRGVRTRGKSAGLESRDRTRSGARCRAGDPAAYTPTPRGPVFMSLIETTFGKDVTTRTWDTIRRVASLR